MSLEKRIIITHCIDPHNFYFKYADECVNIEYSNFDCLLQSYGNSLFDRQLSAHNADKNDLIIFFDVISNKWMRGRVINKNDNGITLWCIDNGILRKTDQQFILPLTENLKRDFNLVQLGGVAVLPAESTLNFETMNVKMQAMHSWDKEMSKSFNVIIDSAKRINFIEEMELEQHKFGTLTTETWKDKVVVVNDILLQMNKAISCGGSAGMASYMHDRRLKEDFHQSLERATTLSNAIHSRRTSIASGKCESEMITNPFKSDTLSNGHADRAQSTENLDKLKKTSDATGQSNVVERNLGPLKPEKTLNKCDKSNMDSVKPKICSGTSDTSNEVKLLLEPVILKPTTSNKSEEEKRINDASDEADRSDEVAKYWELIKSKEATSKSKTLGTSGASDNSVRKELEPDLKSVKPKGKTSSSSKFKTEMPENSFISKKPSESLVKSDWEPVAKPVQTTTNSNKSQTEMPGNSFKPKNTSDVSNKVSAGTEPDSVSVKAKTSVKSEMKIFENPFKPVKLRASGKSDGIELYLEPVKPIEKGSSTLNESERKVEENPFKPKRKSSAAGKSDGTKPDLVSVKPRDISNKSETKLEDSSKHSSASIKCDREPVHTDGTTHKCKMQENPFKPLKISDATSKSAAPEPDLRSDKPKRVASNVPDDNPFNPKTSSGISGNFVGAEQELRSIKPKETVGMSGKSEIEENPFRPIDLSNGVDLHLKPVQRTQNASTSGKSTMEMNENPFKPKKSFSASGMSNGIKLHSEPVKPERTVSLNKSKVDENLFNSTSKDLARTSGAFDKSEMKMNGNSSKLNTSAKPAEAELQLKEISGHSRKSNADSKTKSPQESSKSDHSSLPNGFDERIDSVHNLVSNGTDLPSVDGSIDTLDTISMAVSTIHTFINEAKNHRTTSENPKSVHIDYDCHLKALKFGSGKIQRKPQQSSMNWINEQQFTVADDNESCSSGIIELME